MLPTDAAGPEDSPLADPGFPHDGQSGRVCETTHSGIREEGTRGRPRRLHLSCSSLMGRLRT